MKKVAEFLTVNSEAVLGMSIYDLAAAADTSAATVTRFCQLLGYSGYPAFRVSAIADFGRSKAAEAWTQEVGQDFDPKAPVNEIVRDLLASQITVLQTAVDLLDVEAVHRVAYSVINSRRVDLYGVGGSGVAAVNLEHRLCRIGVNARAWTDLHLGLANAAFLDNDCLSIALSNSGQTLETAELIATARKHGAMTVALTGDPLSPVAKAADSHIRTYMSDEYLNPGELAAHTAQLFVVNLLYLLVARCDHDRAQRSLRATAAAVSGHRPGMPSQSISKDL